MAAKGLLLRTPAPTEEEIGWGSRAISVAAPAIFPFCAPSRRPRKEEATMRADRPRTLEELRRILRGGGEELRLLAGGTDLVPSLRTHPERDLHLVDLSSLEELRVLRIEGDRLEIGSAVTFDELERSFLVRTHARALAAAHRRSAPRKSAIGERSEAIVANASPAADGIPALCALGAAVVIEDEDGAERSLRGGGSSASRPSAPSASAGIFALFALLSQKAPGRTSPKVGSEEV